MWSHPKSVNVICSPGMGGYFFHDLVSAIIGLIKFEVTTLPSNEYTYALKKDDIIDRHHPHDIYDIDTFKGRVNLFINSNDIKMIYYAHALKEMKNAPSETGGNLLAHFANAVCDEHTGQMLDYKKLINHNKKET